TIFIALVICCVFRIELIRLRIALSVAMTYLGLSTRRCGLCIEETRLVAQSACLGAEFYALKVHLNSSSVLVRFALRSLSKLAFLRISAKISGCFDSMNE